MAEYDWTADEVVKPPPAASAARAPMQLPEVDLPKWPPLPEANAGPGPEVPPGTEAAPPAPAPGYDWQADKVAPEGEYERYRRTGRIRITPNNAPPDPNLLPKVPGEDYQPQGPRQAPVGKMQAAGLGVVNGLSFNFADELAGVNAAGLAGSKPAAVEPEAGFLDFLHGLYRLWRERQAAPGEERPATQAYTETTDRFRNLTEQARAEEPVAYYGGNIAGSMAAPGAAAAAPVRATGAAAGSVMREGLRRLGTRMYRGAGVGAVQGGVNGVGEGTDLTDRGVKGAIGTVVGGGIGAVTPIATDVVAIPARAGWRALGDMARRFRNPTSEGARRLGNEVEAAQEREVTRRAAGNEPSTLTPQEFLEAQQRGQPVAVIDTAGRGGKRLAKSVRNTPGADEGTEALEGLVETRFRSQAERTARFLDTLTSGRTATTFDRLLERARSSNAPAYRRAYEQAAALNSAAYQAQKAAGQNRVGAFWTPELRRLSSSPDINDAMAGVGRKEGNRSIIEGFQSPRESPFVQRGDSPRMGLRETETVRAIPSLETWDSVQRVLRGKIGEATRGGNLERARELTLLRERLNTELDRIVPAFREARGTAYRNFRAEDAYEAGLNYVTQLANPRQSQELSRTIANMGLTDRALFMHGFATSLIGRVRATQNNVDVVNRIYESPAARERIVEALGAARAREIEGFLRVEAVMNQSRRAVQGNSSTVEQWLASGMASSIGYGIVTGNWDWSTAAAGVGGAAGRRVAQRAGVQMADRIGEMLASQNPDIYRRAIGMIARNDTYLNNLRTGMAELGRGATPAIAHEAADQRRPSQ